jgi:hypothetical protein
VLSIDARPMMVALSNVLRSACARELFEGRKWNSGTRNSHVLGHHNVAVIGEYETATYNDGIIHVLLALGRNQSPMSAAAQK